jgi:peptide/nickel transport system substrate-binding protein
MRRNSMRLTSGLPRLNRRRLLAGAAYGATMAALAGCRATNPAKSGATSGGQSTPKRGGVVTLSHNLQRGLDPHILQTSDAGIMGLFYSTLVRANPKTYDLEPGLAAKWEAPSQTELVFTLAPNIKWHDKAPANGRPLKVDDIIYSFNRIRSDDPKFINKSYLAGVDSMQAADDHTLKLTLKQPDVTQLNNLTVFGLSVLAPEVVEAAKGTLNSAATVVGTGPYVLQSSEVNVGSSLTRNPAYFKQGLPYADRFELKAFLDEASEWSAFLSGQLSHRWVPGQDSKKFEQEKQAQYQLDWFGDVGYFIVQAMTKKKPFDDARVTKALRLLVDHQEFRTGWAEVWFGRGRSSAIFAAASEPWDMTEDEYSHYLEWKQPKDDAIKEALSLLNAAGFNKDKPLKFTLSGSNGNEYQLASAQLMLAQLKRNGQGAVDCTLKLYDTAAWNGVRSNGDFEYYVGGHSAGATDPDAYFTSTFKTGAGRNYGKMSDPKLDQMFEKQKGIFDEAQRKKAVRDILLYMIDNCPYGSTSTYYDLNATQPAVRQFPAEGPTFKWGDHYESVWTNA